MFKIQTFIINLDLFFAKSMSFLKGIYKKRSISFGSSISYYLLMLYILDLSKKKKNYFNRAVTVLSNVHTKRVGEV